MFFFFSKITQGEKLVPFFFYYYFFLPLINILDSHEKAALCEQWLVCFGFQQPGASPCLFAQQIFDAQLVDKISSPFEHVAKTPAGHH